MNEFGSASCKVQAGSVVSIQWKRLPLQVANGIGAALAQRAHMRDFEARTGAAGTLVRGTGYLTLEGGADLAVARRSRIAGSSARKNTMIEDDEGKSLTLK